MRLFSRAVLICVAVLMVASLAHDADGAQKKKKKKKGGPVAGVVTNIERGTDGGGYIFVQTLAYKGQAGVQRKLAVTKDTKFESTVGKKTDKKTVEGNFSQLLQGEMITVNLRQGATDVADKVALGKSKKKKAA